MVELVRVTLGRDWNKHKEGATLSVDAGRAAWLKESGYLEEQKSEPKVRKPRERVSKSKTD